MKDNFLPSSSLSNEIVDSWLQESSFSGSGPVVSDKSKESPACILRHTHEKEDVTDESPAIEKPFQPEIKWFKVTIFCVLHTAAIYGSYLAVTEAKWITLLWAYFLMVWGAFGTTGGAHRLWCHRSYKAKWPLRLIAALGQTITLNGNLVEWCRIHRIHHRYSETDADPHDARRGFFFSHVGWILCSEHPSVTHAKVTLNLDDILSDPIVYYQRKFYIPLIIVLCLIMPAWVPWYFWGESYMTGFFVAFISRHILSTHLAATVNSVAHKLGYHPYDKSIRPTENQWIAMMTMGEGWHNYHHVFPWDYKAGELGSYGTNWTTAIIDLFASIGWAYDLRSASDNVIHNRVLRKGDGTHPFSRQHEEESSLTKEVHDEITEDE